MHCILLGRCQIPGIDLYPILQKYDFAHAVVITSLIYNNWLCCCQEWAHKQYIAKHQQGPSQQWGNFYYFRMQNIRFVSHAYWFDWMWLINIANGKFLLICTFSFFLCIHPIYLFFFLCNFTTMYTDQLHKYKRVLGTWH